jgi:hypothetical protein
MPQPRHDDRIATRRPSERARRLIFVGTALGVVVAVVTLVGVLRPHRPTPSGQDFSTVNRVSGGPVEWIAAVCDPLARLPATGFDLPESTYWSVCQARVRRDDAFVNPILIARFRSEVPMQVDLDLAGIEWYAFAVDQGELIAFATRSPSPRASPLLQPLKQFRFNIYSDPGISNDVCGKIRCRR